MARSLPYFAATAAKIQCDGQQYRSNWLLTSYGITFYQANATEPEGLAQAHLDTVQHAIVAIDDIEDSLLTIRHLRLNYPDMSLWVRARDRHHVHLLQELGVERIWRKPMLLH